MNVYKIIDNVKAYTRWKFKIGLVGNGEGFLDLPVLKSYIAYADDSPYVRFYTITNGTIPLSDKDILFFEDRGVKVGFSLDGPRDLHNRNRCNTFDVVMSNVERYREIAGHYPTFNATVGRDALEDPDGVIGFFKPFGSRVTFSRMIGRYGIGLDEYREFLAKAEGEIEVRHGGKDCTMYGGQCGAGINNYFFANGKVYYCGNCIDLPPVADSGVSFYELEKIVLEFNRDHCFKEGLCV